MLAIVRLTAVLFAIEQVPPLFARVIVTTIPVVDPVPEQCDAEVRGARNAMVGVAGITNPLPGTVGKVTKIWFPLPRALPLGEPKVKLAVQVVADAPATCEDPENDTAVIEPAAAT